jgi:hypothetical protein
MANGQEGSQREDINSTAYGRINFFWLLIRYILPFRSCFLLPCRVGSLMEANIDQLSQGGGGGGSRGQASPMLIVHITSCGQISMTPSASCSWLWSTNIANDPSISSSMMINLSEDTNAKQIWLANWTYYGTPCIRILMTSPISPSLFGPKNIIDWPVFNATVLNYPGMDAKKANPLMYFIIWPHLPSIFPS